jgi:hypothetical protein
MTPQERQRIVELLKACSVSGASIKALVRSIAKEMPHLTAAELVEVCKVLREEQRLDAAVYSAQAQALGRIAEIVEETGEPNLGGTQNALVARSTQGDRRAAELLAELEHALTVVSMED